MRYYVIGINGVSGVPPTVRICLSTIGGLMYIGATQEYLDVHVIGTVPDKGDITMGLPSMVPEGDAERCYLHFGRVFDGSGNDPLVIEADSDDEAFERFREWCAQRKEEEQ